MRATLVLTALALLVQPVLAGSTVTVLGSGEGWSTVVSNNGVVAGSSTGSGEYFIWTPTDGHLIIGGVSAGNGAGGQAGIDADGTVVCGNIADPQSGYYTAAIYTIAADTWTLHWAGSATRATTPSAVAGACRATAARWWASGGRAAAPMPRIGSARTRGCHLARPIPATHRAPTV